VGRYLTIALRNLLQNKRRSLLLGGAMIVVTMLLILLGAVGNGVQSTILRAGTAMITGHVNVGGFYKITSGQAAPVLVHADQLIKDVKEALPEARHVLDRTRGFGKVISDSDSIMAATTGIDATQEQALAEVLQIIDGDLADLTQGHRILLFEKQAERLKVGVGDEVTLSSPVMKGQNNSLDVRVAAVAKDMGLISIMSCYVSKQTTIDLYQLDPDTTGVVFVYLDDPESAEEVQAALRQDLERRGYRLMDRQEGAFYRKFNQVQGEDWTGMKLDLTTWEDELVGIRWTMDTFDTVTTILIGILLVIIMTGVMNTMWINVRDRTREVGTLRAIGMARHKILVLFLLETAILSAFSAGVGVVLGIAISALLNAMQIPVSQGFQIFLMSETLRMVVVPESVVWALVVIPLLTSIGAFFPALRAARMKPVTAIHHIG